MSEMKRLVTWPSLEWSSRISPDGQWVSFLSDSGGRERLWLQRVRGGQPTAVAEQAGMVNQLWSPDGETIALLVSRGEEVFLQIIPSFGGPPTSSRRLSSDFVNAHLVRWLGSRLYMEVNRQALWRMDTSSGALQQVASARSPEGFHDDFDISRDEKQLAFTIRRGDQLTIWLQDLAGGQPVSLTTGRYNDYAPRFGGATNRDLFFSSDRGGQVDLWRMDLADHQAERITFSATAEYIEDVSADQSLLTFREEREDAHLWTLSRGAHRQLTAESLRDWWPSVSRDRPAVVLQRQKPRIEGLPFFDGQILLASLVDVRSPASWTPVADGLVGWLSFDRKRLAYVRAVASRRYELWTKDLDSAHPWLVTGRFNLPAMYPFPRDWSRTNLAWSANSQTLYFIADEDGGAQIRASEGEGPTKLVVSAPRGVSIQDVHLSGDGKLLGYVTTGGGNKRISAAHVHSILDGNDRTVYSATQDWKGQLYFRGWSSRGSMILLEATSLPDWTQQAAVLEVSAAGAVRRRAGISRTFAGTARVDADRDLLYFVRCGEDLIHNLFSLSLADGAVRQLSDNTIPGITFSGLEVAPDGSLLYVRQESNRDIWTIQFPK